jgi:hypothetical protein
MKVMLAKTVLWMGLLLVLLGESSLRLMAQGGGIPPAPQDPISVVS